ncbi:MAG TPA: hypothetical protein VK513_00325 [Terriglobales bacterium]|nr:hypothetical protein [Terriglobales bacterium]
MKKTVEHISRDRFAIQGSKLRHGGAAEVCQEKAPQSGGEEMFFHIGVRLLKGWKTFPCAGGIDSNALASEFDLQTPQERKALK